MSKSTNNKDYETKRQILLKERNVKRFGFCPNSGDELRIITPFIRICDICGLVFFYDSNHSIIKRISEAEFYN
ncbi:MAG: hypothetical protein ACTSWQ_00560 [Candidatus Thorarchaeota archaeon]